MRASGKKEAAVRRKRSMGSDEDGYFAIFADYADCEFCRVGG